MLGASLLFFSYRTSAYKGAGDSQEEFGLAVSQGALLRCHQHRERHIDGLLS